MTKLSEVLAAKSGNWFAVGDVVGVPLTVTEDVSLQSDIRQTADEQYYCVQVSNAVEVKDLHLGKGALRALAAAMPQTSTWKGQRFQINAVTGKGFQTKTHVSLLQGDYSPAAQQRLPVSAPMAAHVEQATGAFDDIVARIEAVRGVVPATDEVVEACIRQYCAERAEACDAGRVSFVFGILKQSGRIVQDVDRKTWRKAT